MSIKFVCVNKGLKLTKTTAFHSNKMFTHIFFLLTCKFLYFKYCISVAGLIIFMQIDTILAEDYEVHGFDRVYN